MTHAWWDQVVAELAVRVPETVRDVYEPFGDSMVIVDRRGQRVVNEKIPYNERAQVHFAWDRCAASTRTCCSSWSGTRRWPPTPIPRARPVRRRVSATTS